MSAPFLEIAGLFAGYGGADVLKGASLSVARGSITCLLGPNGAGKTTLMNTVAGLLRPRSGMVRLEGRDLTGRPPHVIAAQGIALVTQDKLTFHNLSVLDNLRVGAWLRNDRSGIEADLTRIGARFPRLWERRDQRAGTLSGGERQMLAMARAMMTRPALLLLDEPSLGLAPRIVRDLFCLIREINAEGTSVLLVEQNAAAALEIGHHVHLIEQGRVTFSGDPGRLARGGIIEKAYLGRLRDNAVPAPLPGA